MNNLIIIQLLSSDLIPFAVCIHKYFLAEFTIFFKLLFKHTSKIVCTLNCSLAVIIRRFSSDGALARLNLCALTQHTLEHKILLVCSKFKINKIICCFGHRTCIDPLAQIFRIFLYRIFVWRHLCSSITTTFSQVRCINVFVCDVCVRNRMRYVCTTSVRTCECLMRASGYVECMRTIVSAYELKKKRKCEHIS